MFETVNYLEGALWCIIGLCFLVVAARASQRKRFRCLLLGVVLIAFGGSDVIEVKTGAWWRPWWLLMWKAGCLLILVQQFVRYLQEQRKPKE